MTKASAALIVVMACVAAAFAMGYLSVRQDYNLLSQKYEDLQTNYNALNSQYSSLQANHSQLQSQYSSLNNQYASLNSQYQSLQGMYNLLSSDYDALLGECARLNSTVANIISTTDSYAGLTASFPRVLNDNAVKATASAVTAAGASKSDYWGSIQKIYRYVTSNIAYVHDIEMPYWYISHTMTIKGQTYIYGADYFKFQNYIQTPELTLEIKQGDCDDQAILAYAMIKYYMKYVYGTEYSLYLAHVEFSDGSAHLSVVMPVQGGNICIIDPAGSYLTSTLYIWQYVITQKPALQELQAYSNHWKYGGGTGPITYIKLYRVNVVDGSYTVAAEGTISQVAAALAY